MMFNKYFTEKDALILIGSFLFSIGLAVAALSFVYWAVLFATIFIARKRIIRRRDLEHRRRQKATADRLLGRDPDAFPLPDDPERKKQ